MLVNFGQWHPSAFRRALGEEKVVLLSLSTSWCHFCREMDRMTYSQEKIASFMEENFVPVRVDADRRPDINRRYNQGGFPSTVFLTPSGEIISGATFLPPDDFLTIATQVLKIYQGQLLQGKVGRLTGAPAMSDSPAAGLVPGAKESLYDSDKDNFLLLFEREVREKFDPLFGGFGASPKFSHPDVLRFCLKRFLASGDLTWLTILNHSLEAYSEGGLFDHLEGGFFRYSSDRRFNEPHFEKLLEDNLRLIQLFDEVGRQTREKRFCAVAEATLSFINSWLRVDHFYGSSVAAQSDYYLSLSRAARAQAEKPEIDRTVFAHANGLAALILGDLGRDDEAKSLVRELFRALPDETGLFRHILGENDPPPAYFLPDQVWPLAALSRNYPDEKKLTADLLRLLLLNFYDEENGGFLDRFSPETIGLLKQKIKPLRENLILIDLLSKFGYADRARKSLVEIFDLYHQPYLSYAPLAIFLVDTSAPLSVNPEPVERVDKHGKI